MFAKQLPLSIPINIEPSFDNFYVGRNGFAIALMRAMSEGEGEQFLYIWGESGVGCTHLLKACLERAQEYGLKTAYQDMQTRLPLNPEALDSILDADLVCLDRVDTLAGDSPWERQLFAVFNTIRDTGRTRLIMSGQSPPATLHTMLPDLRSRLSWGVVYQMQPLSDEDKLRALKDRAAARGLHLSDGLMNYLMRRCPRSLSDLFAMLETLDEASLAAQRRLTIPFAKTVLGL